MTFTSFIRHRSQDLIEFRETHLTCLLLCCHVFSSVNSGLFSLSISTLSLFLSPFLCSPYYSYSIISFFYFFPSTSLFISIFFLNVLPFLFLSTLSICRSLYFPSSLVWNYVLHLSPFSLSHFLSLFSLYNENSVSLFYCLSLSLCQFIYRLCFSSFLLPSFLFSLHHFISFYFFSSAPLLSLLVFSSLLLSLFSFVTFSLLLEQTLCLPCLFSSLSLSLYYFPLSFEYKPTNLFSFLSLSLFSHTHTQAQLCWLEAQSALAKWLNSAGSRDEEEEILQRRVCAQITETSSRSHIITLS